MHYSKLWQPIVLAAAAIVVSCSHLNELAHYKLDGATIMFAEELASDMGQVNVCYASVESSESDDDDDGSDATEAALTIAGSVGKALLRQGAEDKLRRAAKPDKVVQGLSAGVEMTLLKYGRIRVSEVLNDKVAFIVITTLDKLELRSSPSGIQLRVSATTAMIDRKSGKTIWQNCEAHTKALRRHSTGNNKPVSATAKTIADALQLADLLSLSESEMADAIADASRAVGQLMATTLRKDVTRARVKWKS